MLLADRRLIRPSYSCSDTGGDDSRWEVEPLDIPTGVVTGALMASIRGAEAFGQPSDATLGTIVNALLLDVLLTLVLVGAPLWIEVLVGALGTAACADELTGGGFMGGTAGPDTIVGLNVAAVDAGGAMGATVALGADVTGARSLVGA